MATIFDLEQDNKKSKQEKNLCNYHVSFDGPEEFSQLDIRKVFGSSPIYLAHQRLIQHDEKYHLCSIDQSIQRKKCFY